MAALLLPKSGRYHLRQQMDLWNEFSLIHPLTQMVPTEQPL